MYPASLLLFFLVTHAGKLSIDDNGSGLHSLTMRMQNSLRSIS